MSDSVYTTIEFGGKITVKDLEALCDLLDQDGAENEGGDSPSVGLFQEAVREQWVLKFICYEQPQGSFPEVEDFCEKHGIVCRRINSPKGEINGECAYFSPSIGWKFGIYTDNEGACVSVAQLKRYLSEGRSLQSVVEEHQPFADPLPVIEISEE